MLEQQCLVCHAADNPQAGLRLTDPASVLAGGRSGPAIVPGHAAQSLLIEKVVSGSMPPGDGRLTPEQIAVLREWIDAGAGDLGLAAARPPVTDRDVLPIFQMRCVACHGKRRQEAGLDLRTVASRIAGGDSGPAVVPGKPDESFLIRKLLEGDMPPLALQREYSVRPPTEDEIELLRQWIADGAREAPAEPEAAEAAVPESAKEFWSFQPPVKSAVPVVEQADQVENPIDAFLLEKLEAEGLSFSTEAEPLDLMRRAYIDLIGMPPTETEIRDYLADARPDRYERLVDRLLDSSHYGEKWGRHWLDLAGYSDSIGFGFDDGIRPYAWRYRDYVIRAMNADKPYDRFLTEQIAGDELGDWRDQPVTQDLIDRMAATGFLRTVPDPTNHPSRAFISERSNVLFDEMQVLSSGVLGLTMNCARCHDHKFDPIPQKDYYRLSAVLQRAYDLYDWVRPRDRELPLALEEEKQAVKAFNEPIEHEIAQQKAAIEKVAASYRERYFEESLGTVPEDVRPDLRALQGVPTNQRSEVQQYLAKKFRKMIAPTVDELAAAYPTLATALAPLQEQVKKLEGKLKTAPHVRVLMDVGGEPSSAYLLRRGDPMNPGVAVEPGPPSVLTVGLEPYRIEEPWEGADSSGARLALARWLTQPNHPLTGRVIVNQLWRQHFGRGIVATPDNFGKTGERPTHPELLDWLAVELVDNGWSLKHMHRLMMTSRAYRQASAIDSDAVLEADPLNEMLSRMPLRRMSAEELYDSILRASGRWDPTPFGPPELVDILPNEEVVPRGSDKGYRRSVYVLQRKSTPASLHEVFDLPQMSPNCTERRESTVPTQALQMMNSGRIWELSKFMAGRLIEDAPEGSEAQIELAYLRAFSRPPTEAEVKVAAGAIDEFAATWPRRLEDRYASTPREWTVRWLSLAALCQTLLNSAEFSYVD